MDYTRILSSADRLRSTSGFKVYINDEVRDYLHKINSMIMDAQQVGRSKIEYRLPVNFKILDENISNEEIQTSIYFKIVSELESKKYNISINILQDYTILYIEWTAKTDKNELNNMKNKLISLMRVDTRKSNKPLKGCRKI